MEHLSIAKGLLPDRLLRHLRAIRDLDSTARWTYISRQVSRLGRRSATRPAAAAPASILFICHGNIIRSAMAEQLLRRECAASGGEPVGIRSAGMHARAGRPADARAIDLAPEFGVSLATHRAAELTAEAVTAADLIVVMDFLNEADLLSRFPAAAPKVRLIGEYFDSDGSNGALELPDPYMEDAAAVRASFVRLEQGVRRLIAVHRLASTSSNKRA